MSVATTLPVNTKLEEDLDSLLPPRAQSFQSLFPEHIDTKPELSALTAGLYEFLTSENPVERVLSSADILASLKNNPELMLQLDQFIVDNLLSNCMWLEWSQQKALLELIHSLPPYEDPNPHY